MNFEMHSRRSVLQRTASLAPATQVPAILRAASSADEAQAALERAHTDLWRRFGDQQDVLLDFTELDGSVSPSRCSSMPGTNGRRAVSSCPKSGRAPPAWRPSSGRSTSRAADRCVCEVQNMERLTE